MRTGEVSKLLSKECFASEYLNLFDLSRVLITFSSRSKTLSIRDTLTTYIVHDLTIQGTAGVLTLKTDNVVDLSLTPTKSILI